MTAPQENSDAAARYSADVEQEHEIAQLKSELDGLKASRIAYANEFPLNADGEPDVGNIHANIRSLKAQLAEAKSRIKELETPTIFWDFNNPEHGAFDSLYSAICDGDFDEGTEVSFMTARALPTKTVRITRDSDGDYDYEYIDAVKGESNA